MLLGMAGKKAGTLHPATLRPVFQPQVILVHLKCPCLGAQTFQDPSPTENLPMDQYHLNPAHLGTQTTQDQSNLKHKLPIYPGKRPP